MINKETVEYFPKGAVITNVDSGDIVDDEAVIDEFKRRKKKERKTKSKQRDGVSQKKG